MNSQQTNDWASEIEIPNTENLQADPRTLVLPSGEVTITDSAQVLFTRIARTHRLFVRGGRVQKLGRREDGVLKLEILTAEEACSEFEKHGRLVAWRVDGRGASVLKPTICRVDTAKSLLATEEARRLLPPVRGLINCPVIFEQDGQLQIAGPGYNERAKTLVTGGKMPPEVGLEAATKALLDLLSEFNFQSDGDKSRATASFLDPALKLGGFIPGRVPADVAEADQSQSGKTYRQKLRAAIYNERVSLVVNRQGGVGSVDESLGEQLVAGRPFIQLDNFRGRLDSQNMEALLTAEGSFPCRLPHRGQIEIDPESFFICLTSNGVDTTKDFANRSCIIRIRKQPPGFDYRKYPEGDLLAHVRANQAHYLGCVFAVIRAWHREGKPQTSETRHDFRAWVRVLDWIVQKIFKLPPIMDGHQEAQERVSNPDQVWLRTVALAVAKTTTFGQPSSAYEIAVLCETEGIQIPGLKGYVNDPERAARVVGSCMKRLFHDRQLLEVESYEVERCEGEKQRREGGIFPTKTYVFRHKSDPAKSVPTDRLTVPPALAVGSESHSSASAGTCFFNKFTDVEKGFQQPPDSCSSTTLNTGCPEADSAATVPAKVF